MNTNFTWSQTEKGEKAILYNGYLYRLRRENQNGSLIYVCTFKRCSRTISLKNYEIVTTNGGNHNHDPKLPENVHAVFCGLKRRVLTNIDQPVTKLYEGELKKIVIVCSFYLNSIVTIIFTLFSIVKTVQLVQFPSSTHGNQHCTQFAKQYYLTPISLSLIIIPRDMCYNNNNNNQEFLFCNSPTPHKVIAFASEQALKLLSDNPHWNGDGTFRTSPALFTQSYYIHV